MNIQIIRLAHPNTALKKLVKELDDYLAITDGDEHDFYDQFNSIDEVTNFVLASIDDNPVGCGAFKAYDKASTEIKRMYVKPENRRDGIASKVLIELEKWSAELGYESCLLETGKRQVEAVKFYQKAGYKIIEKYGQYADMDNSLCFKKELT